MMKKTLAVTLLAVAVALAHAVASDTSAPSKTDAKEYRIHFEYKPGDDILLEQTVEQTMQITSGSEAPKTLSTKLKVVWGIAVGKATKADQKEFTLEIRRIRLSNKVPGGESLVDTDKPETLKHNPPFRVFKDLNFKVTVDAKGKVSKVSYLSKKGGEAKIPPSPNWMVERMCEGIDQLVTRPIEFLPSKAVRIGGTWRPEKQLSLTALASLSQYEILVPSICCTLESVSKTKAGQIAVIRFKGTCKIPGLAAEEVEMKVEGHMNYIMDKNILVSHVVSVKGTLTEPKSAATTKPASANFRLSMSTRLSPDRPKATTIPAEE